MQQESLLFRQEAIEAQETPSLGTIRLATPVSHQVWTLAITSIAVAILAWLFVGQYARREHVAGSLVPQAGLLTLTARSAGSVTSVAVAEGAVDTVRDLGKDLPVKVPDAAKKMLDLFLGK